MKTDFKEKTEMVPWCQLKELMIKTLVYTCTYCCSKYFLIAMQLVFYYPEDQLPDVTSNSPTSILPLSYLQEISEL